MWQKRETKVIEVACVPVGPWVKIPRFSINVAEGYGHCDWFCVFTGGFSVSLLVDFVVTVIVSREWLVGFLYSSSDLLLLFGFFWLSRWASTCCFEEDPDYRARATSVTAAA
jgi:hypothetical protein